MSGARVKSVAVLAGVVLAGVTAAAAQAGGDDGHEADLTGYQEVPAISSDGEGTFKLRIAHDGDELRYRLRYEDTSSDVTQAHVHIGQTGVSGGISLFLCSNLDNGPSGTPDCPDEGQVSGTLSEDDVVGPAAQGIAAGELDEVVAAIEAGVAYANVHTKDFPAGEIRGQIGH